MFVANARPERSRWIRCPRFSLRTLLLGLAAMSCAVCMAARCWPHPPEGIAHLCTLGVKLQLYAERHDGRFPAGAATPEASLCLLAPAPGAALWFRGKGVREQDAARELAATGALGPKTCGWHYIEGLTLADDSRLALIWDKAAGFDHDGVWRGNRKREVGFVDGTKKFISDVEWPAFLVEQQLHWAARRIRDARR
ncbi:MAG: hypothetical protein HZA54_06165 [Planctomycetes bacterium]|nr:hypothetical protein [Planctomycetota bacterium]